MDSLSTVIEGDENKGDYADYLYELARATAIPPVSEFGFPGLQQFSGSTTTGRTTPTSVAQTAWQTPWTRSGACEKMTRGGRGRVRPQTSECVTIGKSRNNRSGDRFMTTMHDGTSPWRWLMT